MQINSEDQMETRKKIIDEELDKLQDRLSYHGSSIIKNIELKKCYSLNPMKDGYNIDTEIDAALNLLIKQTIRLCLIKQTILLNLE